MKCAIAIFTKTRGLSPLKTRLAKDIGKEAAETFHRLSVDSIVEVLNEVKDNLEDQLNPHWALAEEEGVGHPDWQSFPAIWTGEGDLGQRLHSVSQRLFESHDAVMMIGTDCSQLLPHEFEQALTALNENPDKIVIGPADDGGFYLLVSKIPIDEEIWKGVSYSQESTLQELIGLLEDQGKSVHLMELQTDVDTLESLKMLKVTLEQNSTKLLPAQVVLHKWINKLDI